MKQPCNSPSREHVRWGSCTSSRYRFCEPTEIFYCGLDFTENFSEDRPSSTSQMQDWTKTGSQDSNKNEFLTCFCRASTVYRERRRHSTRIYNHRINWKIRMIYVFDWTTVNRRGWPNPTPDALVLTESLVLSLPDCRLTSVNVVCPLA